MTCAHSLQAQRNVDFEQAERLPILFPCKGDPLNQGAGISIVPLGRRPDNQRAPGWLFLFALTLQSVPELFKHSDEALALLLTQVGKQFGDLFFVFRAARG